jgi:hypothetical protein
MNIKSVEYQLFLGAMTILLAGTIWDLAGALINIQRLAGMQRQKDQCKSKFIFFGEIESQFIYGSFRIPVHVFGSSRILVRTYIHKESRFMC